MFDAAVCERIDLSAFGGPRGERADDATSAWDAAMERFAQKFCSPDMAAPPRLRRLVDQVCSREKLLASLTDAELLAAAQALRAPLLARGFARDLVVEAFALTREATVRHLGYRHHRVQILGGAAMLTGAFIEMATGEGKTVTALLPAVTAALAGASVHVVTVNDYLARRDAEQMGQIFRALGLTVGLMQHGQTAAVRRAAYSADVVYCTNKELAFDYLRDRIALGPVRAERRLRLDEMLGEGKVAGALLLRGLHFAIVDEADSVLIDEARTPLIISSDRGDDKAEALYRAALALARDMVDRRHFAIGRGERKIDLTGVGEAAIDSAGLPEAHPWRSKLARRELVRQALTALHLFERDVHYILAEGKVQIVDEYTGRVMADRFWERGLQQLIEIKEGLPASGRRETLARITYQRFFQRYLRLSGMSGTLREVAGELRATYRVPVIPIPTHRRLRRRDGGVRLARRAADKWRRVARRALQMAARGRPVLIGTRSVAASEALAEVLLAMGAAPVVLNARQDADEAAVIAQAGEKGRITIATNMAGRGADIVLTPESRAVGGLHVILTEFHESPRIDRQLYGRAGRQGDPGSVEQIVALDDELFRRYARKLAATLSALPFF